MLESELPFPQVGNPELIDQRIANRPRVTWVPLLETLLYKRAIARNIRSRGLKVIERGMRGSVGEVVVDAQILTIIDLVIHAESELVLIVRLGRDSLIPTSRQIRRREVLLHQVQGHRIHTRRWNERSRENRTPWDVRQVVVTWVRHRRYARDRRYKIGRAHV